jgi:hypothetical protein
MLYGRAEGRDHAGPVSGDGLQAGRKGPQVAHNSCAVGGPHTFHQLNGTMRHTAAQLLKRRCKPLTSLNAGEQGSPIFWGSWSQGVTAPLKAEGGRFDPAPDHQIQQPP